MYFTMNVVIWCEKVLREKIHRSLKIEFDFHINISDNPTKVELTEKDVVIVDDDQRYADSRQYGANIIFISDHPQTVTSDTRVVPTEEMGTLKRVVGTRLRLYRSA